MAEPVVRRAVDRDRPLLQELRRAFDHDVADRGPGAGSTGRGFDGIADALAVGGGFVAECDGQLTGYALWRPSGPGVIRLVDLYVVPSERRSGTAAALVRAVAADAAGSGADVLDVEVAATDGVARTLGHRWGFREESVVLSASVERLLDRLHPSAHGVSFASIHVQTDDVGWVERTAAQFAPRIGSPGSRIEGPRNGWTAVYDPVADADPSALLRYAREVSDRMGAVVVALSLELDQVVRMIALDRGGVVDEYLSVPEFYGQLPPGDVIGLAANATVLHRLTGADPAAVRAVARTAVSPHELPPARELLAAIAGVLGLEGALHGFVADG